MLKVPRFKLEANNWGVLSGLCGKALGPHAVGHLWRSGSARSVHLSVMVYSGVLLSPDHPSNFGFHILQTHTALRARLGPADIGLILFCCMKVALKASKSLICTSARQTTEEIQHLCQSSSSDYLRLLWQVGGLIYRQAAMANVGWDSSTTDA